MRHLCSSMPAPARLLGINASLLAHTRRASGSLGSLLLLLCAGLSTARAADPLPLPSFDFVNPTEAQRWQAAHDIARVEPAADGLLVHISGSDPYLFGPARDFPPGKLLWLNVRLKSDQGGTAQVFYFTDSPTESQSVRFNAPAGEWHEATVPVPTLGAKYRLRIDPPGTGGRCLLGRLWFEERTVYAAPAWPRPKVPVLGEDAVSVQSGNLRLIHNRTNIGGFAIEVAGRRAAVGHTEGLIGYVLNDQVRWSTPRMSPGHTVSVKQAGDGLKVDSSWRDADGARWSWTQTYAPVADEAIAVESSISVDQDRSVLYLPFFTLFPGVGANGTNKNQALLPGVEYLENEPSSSEADLTGPAAWRLAPDTLKITFPLMAIQSDDRYLGLIWEPQTNLCAVHDSPDRQFNSGGHLMSLVFPGSDGVNREERSLLPYRPERLAANQPIRVKATIIGGRGASIVPAVQHYVRLAGLPSIPDPGYTAPEYFELAARGWLESRIRETNLYRHAYWPGFNAQPAADAAVWMRWLATQVDSPDLAASLTNASAAALSVVARQNYDASQIGHIRYPLPSLVFGAVVENANQAKARGETLRNRFEPDGSVLYRPQGEVDYGKTHWAREANGLTAQAVESLLEAAAFAGDRALLDAGIHHLRALDKFRNTVPRGAQTWEVPLHTPDILASAHLVRAYTLGHELTGESEFLEQAKYWAWTGVPFIYLTPPTSGPVGLYSTIPVLGATGWVAPVWIGQPVQWCGLVYADALFRLLPHDPSGPWKDLANGITAAGIQHTWPSSDADRKGLLPDFYHLRAQRSDGPAINPATLQVNALRFYKGPAAYEFRSFLGHGLLVHSPGALSRVVERKEGVRFEVIPWSLSQCRLWVTGFKQPPKVRINGAQVALQFPHQFQQPEGRLVLSLQGPSAVELDYPALAAVDIRRAAVAGFIDVRWPASDAPFVLETSSNIADPDRWAPSSAPVLNQGESFVARRPLLEGNEFFRLQAPTVAGLTSAP